MKKQIAVLCLFLLLVWQVSAQNYNAFRISSPNNAHAEIMNPSSGVHYEGATGGAIVQLTEEITGNTNPVLWLSGETNAHISTSQSADYNEPIYIGDRYRDCNLETDNTCPSGNYECIIALSSDTNAHASACGTADYRHLCCEFDFCGNGECNTGEQCGDTDVAPECNTDCGSCPPTCGNANCDAGECTNCPQDCSIAECCGSGSLGEGECNAGVGENCNTCSADCPCPPHIPICEPTLEICVQCIDAGTHCLKHDAGDVCYLEDNSACDKDGSYYCMQNPNNENEWDVFEQQFIDPECNSNTCSYPWQDAWIYDCMGLGCYDSDGDGPIYAECKTCAEACADAGYQCGIHTFGGSVWNTIDCDCGTCPGGEECNTVTGQCEVCNPDCTGRECGLDPVCGQPCGLYGGDCQPDIDGDPVCGAGGNKDIIYITKMTWDCVDSICVYNPITEEVKDCRDEGKVCASGQCVLISEVYWADMNGDPILKAQVEDTVMMVYENQAGSSFNFDIYEDDLIEQFIKTIPAADTFSFGNHLAAAWTITQEDMIAGGDENPASFFFRVGTEEPIDKLEVTNTIKNDPPIITFSSPQNKEIYYTGENLQFEFTVEDKDDLLDLELDFDDGTKQEVDEGQIITHSYSAGAEGQRTIKLIATEQGRDNQEYIGRVSIVIIDPSASAATNYEFAFINKPLWGEGIYGLEADFLAEDSFAVETTGCSGIATCTINCLAGGCPMETRVDSTDPNIQPIGGAKPMEDYTDSDYTDLEFSWSFDGGLEGTYTASGDAGKDFKKRFGAFGEHKADLDVSYTG